MIGDRSGVRGPGRAVLVLPLFLFGAQLTVSSFGWFECEVDLTLWIMGR